MPFIQHVLQACVLSSLSPFAFWQFRRSVQCVIDVYGGCWSWWSGGGRTGGGSGGASSGGASGGRSGGARNGVSKTVSPAAVAVSSRCCCCCPSLWFRCVGGEGVT